MAQFTVKKIAKSGRLPELTFELDGKEFTGDCTLSRALTDTTNEYDAGCISGPWECAETHDRWFTRLEGSRINVRIDSFTYQHSAMVVANIIKGNVERVRAAFAEKYPACDQTATIEI